MLLLITFLSCKKSTNKIFLKINKINDSTLFDLKVNDANGVVLIDSNFHEVSSRLEISYVLKNKVKYETLNWTPQMNANHFTYSNFYINEYLGEFKHDETDSYLILNISYNTDKGEPIYNKPIYTQWGTFGDYYFYAYDYIDNSKLIIQSN